MSLITIGGINIVKTIQVQNFCQKFGFCPIFFEIFWLICFKEALFSSHSFTFYFDVVFKNSKWLMSDLEQLLTLKLDFFGSFISTSFLYMFSERS